MSITGAEQGKRRSKELWAPRVPLPVRWASSMSRTDFQAMAPDLQHPAPHSHCFWALTSWEALFSLL